MDLLPELLNKFGRLIGFHEAKKGLRLGLPFTLVLKTGTRFFVTSGSSLVAVGAFGTKLLKSIPQWWTGSQLFTYACTTKHSSLVTWMKWLRLPGFPTLAFNCIWTGDHKQTPGGLKKTEEAKAFHKQVMGRPIGLRSGTSLV